MGEEQCFRVECVRSHRRRHDSAILITFSMKNTQGHPVCQKKIPVKVEDPPFLPSITS